MSCVAEQVVSFFADNIPTRYAMIRGGPLGLFWAYVCLYFAGSLKKHQGIKTGYTRKIFHFLIFGSAVVIQEIWGTPSVCLFGGMCTIVIFYAVARGDGHVLYEAMAREKDAPHRTHYIVVPYFATLVGGLASNIAFGPVAVVGYLVTGLGDAVGEPVGTRFGRHTYRVPSLTRVEAVRSLEGSAAVFIACVVAITVGIVLCCEVRLTSAAIIAVPVLGLVCSGVEAVSPHGWDNATMQVIPCFLVTFLL